MRQWIFLPAALCLTWSGDRLLYATNRVSAEHTVWLPMEITAILEGYRVYVVCKTNNYCLSYLKVGMEGVEEENVRINVW